jgi:hypothetical protein
VFVPRFEPAIVLVAALLAGCAPASAPPPSVLPANDCTIRSGAAGPSISFGVNQSIEGAHAPVARNPGEAMVYRQLYETLVTVDCTGRAVPGLADSWSMQEDGRVWRFRLRNDATFWDGERVTAQHVVESWQRAASLGAKAPTAFALVNVVNTRELQVELHVPTARVQLFAQPHLAVTRGNGASPVGSGLFRVGEGSNAQVIRLVRRDAEQTIEIRDNERSDPRALLDVGVDGLVSSDPAVLQYAAALRNYTITPLPWSRTYTLLVPHAGDTTAAAAAAELAARSTPVPTRPAAHPWWWAEDECTRRRQRGPAPIWMPSPAIVFPEGDPIARAVAERLVAIAWPAQRAPAWLRSLLPENYTRGSAPIVQPLDARRFPEAFRGRPRLAAVLPVPRNTQTGCAGAHADEYAELLITQGLNVVPLFDARDYLIHRGNLGHVLVDGDGVLRLMGNRR